MKRSWTFGALALSGAVAFAGCGNSSTTAESTPSNVAPPIPADAEAPVLQDVPEKIDVNAVRDTARTAMFVPAPSEFQAALKVSAEGIDMRKLVQDSDRTLQGKQKPIIALETGVRISNVLMTVHAGDKAATLGRMRKAKEGLTALQAPASVVAEIDRVIADYDGGALSQVELTPALDVLAERINDDLLTGTDVQTATLVQAGGWVQGANLLAKAVGGAGLGGDAAALLNQPTLLAYFLDFLKNSDPGRAGDPDVVAVIGELEKMQAVVANGELTTEDVNAIAGHTDAILARF